MDRHLTDDQKNLVASMEDLQKHPGWIKFKGIMEDRLKELDMYIHGEVDMRNPNTGLIENLDEIKYSMGKVLRTEWKMLNDLIKKPDEIIKKTGILS